MATQEERSQSESPARDAGALPLRAIAAFFVELRRRRVFRALIAWGIAGFAVPRELDEGIAFWKEGDEDLPLLVEAKAMRARLAKAHARRH